MKDYDLSLTSSAINQENILGSKDTWPPAGIRLHPPMILSLMEPAYLSWQNTMGTHLFFQGMPLQMIWQTI